MFKPGYVISRNLYVAPTLLKKKKKKRERERNFNLVPRTRCTVFARTVWNERENGLGGGGEAVNLPVLRVSARLACWGLVTENSACATDLRPCCVDGRT